MSESPALWHWTIEDGEPQAGPEDELIRQLSAGRLPPYALVWREGWAEWLPAMQVDELSEAFPDVGSLGTRTPRPSSIPGIPPVPVSDYPRLRHLAKGAPLGWPDGFEGPEEEVITSEVPAAIMLEAARVMTEPSPPADLGIGEAIERASRLPMERLSLLPARPSLLPARPSLAPGWVPPPAERASLVPGRVPLLPERASFAPREAERTPVSGPALPLATELGLGALLEDAAPARSWAQWLRAHGPWLALGVLVLALGAVFALRQLGVLPGAPPRPAPRAEPPPAVSSSQVSLGSARASAPSAAASCGFSQPPAELDDWAVVDVRPVLHPLASGRELAIGYAQSRRSATGGVLDVGSLRLARQFWQQQDRQVFSVTPLEVDGVLRYHVERQGTNVAFARAVAAQPPVRLGMGDDGLVIGPLERRLEKLWALQPGSTITVPELAEHPLGFTLALRTAGDLGRVHLGLINAAGEAVAPLAEVGSPAWDLGRPALASGPEQTVLAVSRRGEGDQADELMLARARNGQLPTELRRFELPAPAAPELLAPVVAALPDGGFALMWSQGPSDARQVRLQRLSAELMPLGRAFDVTPAAPASDATAAALHWIDDRLLAFYFARRAAGHSLWVGSIACGS